MCAAVYRFLIWLNLYFYCLSLSLNILLFFCVLCIDYLAYEFTPNVIRFLHQSDYFLCSSSSRLTALESDRCSNSMHTRWSSKFDWIRVGVLCKEATWDIFLDSREKNAFSLISLRLSWETRWVLLMLAYAAYALPFASTCCLLLLGFVDVIDITDAFCHDEDWILRNFRIEKNNFIQFDIKWISQQFSSEIIKQPEYY